MRRVTVSFAQREQFGRLEQIITIVARVLQYRVKGPIEHAFAAEIFFRRDRRAAEDIQTRKKQQQAIEPSKGRPHRATAQDQSTPDVQIVRKFTLFWMTRASACKTSIQRRSIASCFFPLNGKIGCE